MSHECSNCNTPIPEKVYTYSKTKFNKPLCLKCQSKFDSKPLSNNTFNYNMIKGRIAEALIEQLFIKLEYNVYRYGMENTIPGIIGLLGQIKDDVSNTIKRMPDFVVQDKSGKAYFIEVKFSKNEEFSIKNLKENSKGLYPFPNAFFIVVSKRHIKCISYEDLKAGKKITPDTHNYLGNVKEFETDKEVIKEFCEYAIKFFEGV